MNSVEPDSHKVVWVDLPFAIHICRLKTDIFTLNSPISTNEVSMFKLAIEVCLKILLCTDSRCILFANIDEIRILFLGHPV